MKLYDLYDSQYPPISRTVDVMRMVLCEETSGKHRSCGRSPGSTTSLGNDVTDMSIERNRFNGTGYDNCSSLHHLPELRTDSHFLHGSSMGCCTVTGQGRG
jgi:hypothetical protein